MEPRLQRRVQRYGWDKASDHYENAWSEQLRPAQERLLALAALRPGERVLDVACGTGLVSFPAAEAVGPAGEVVGTDLSERMVETAQEEADRRGHARVRFLRADAESLGLPDGGFDVVLCALGLMYFPEPLRSLREMHRVLRPGGRISVAVWGERARCGWAEIFPIVDARVQSEVCPLFFHLGTGGSLERQIEEAGFSGVRAERVATVLHYRNAEEACIAAFAGGPVALAYSKFDDRTREEAHAEYLSTIESYRNGEGYAIPGQFVVVSAHKGGAGA